MFVGHFAVACAAKRVAPAASLGTLFFAAQFLDLLWPLFVVTGVEWLALAPPGSVFPLLFEHYPWSHSLLMAAAWAVTVGGGYWLLRRDGRAAFVVGLLVASHWLLDLLTHFPDLPLAPGPAPKLGLSLWAWPMTALVVELALFAAGFALYLKSTRPLRVAGRAGAWALAAFLVLIQLANAFGPPPPSPMAVAWTAMAMWLLVAWAWWIDRARAPG